MLVFGLISPHPPIIIPEIGKEDTKKVHQTIEALERAVEELAQAKPEELIVISPHEDHGFEVPEHYLRQRLPDDTGVQEILVTEPSYQYYFEYGQRIGQAIEKESKRYAIVASGDLSHVLKPDGPYGFHPAGPQLDEIIVRAVQAHDTQALLTIDPEILEGGEECGLRSILFLLGAVEGAGFEPQVLSYEGPFGVGYMAATFEKNPRPIELARRSISHYLEAGKLLAAPENLPDSLKRKAGAFVSLHRPNGELRGCIGTISPTKATLAEEIIANAVAAALDDPRFSPVTPDEFNNLTISVDVLSQPVPEPDLAKLNPKTYGLVVTAIDGRQGVLLPDLEGVDTAQEQIEICREKGGIGPNEPVKIRKFRVERYSNLTQP